MFPPPHSSGAHMPALQYLALPARWCLIFPSVVGVHIAALQYPLMLSASSLVDVCKCVGVTIWLFCIRIVFYPDLAFGREGFSLSVALFCCPMRLGHIIIDL